MAGGAHRGHRFGSFARGVYLAGKRRGVGGVPRSLRA